MFACNCKGLIVSKYKYIPNNDDVDKKVIPAIGPYNRKVMGINKKIV